MQDTNQFVVTYDTLKTVVFDTETGQILRQIASDSSSSGDPNYRINRLISHPSQPIIITAHDDRKIRYFDSNSGKEILWKLHISSYSKFAMYAHSSRKGCQVYDVGVRKPKSVVPAT